MFELVGVGDDLVSVEIGAIMVDRIVELRVGPGVMVETAVLVAVTRAA